MTNFVRVFCCIPFLLLASQFAVAQVPVVDSISGVIASDGGVGTGKIKLTGSGGATAASTVKGNYEAYDVTKQKWISIATGFVSYLTGAGPITINDPRTLTTGVTYRVYLTIERGGVVVASSYSNAFAAP